MKPHRILLVDDDPMVIRVLGRGLELSGYDVRTFADGASALEAMARDRFDVVVTDLLMEPVNGIEVLRKTKDRFPDVIVIMLTGYGDAQAAVDAFRMGADDYLIKPCKLDELTFRITRCLEKREALRNTEAARKRIEKSRRFLQATLDALTPHIAILDAGATILAVNDSWRRFADENDLKSNGYCVGMNYLDVCGSAVREEDETAKIADSGIRAVITGAKPVMTLEYPCHSPEQKRWFLMHATRFSEGEEIRVAISHIDITPRKKAEEALRNSEAEFRALVESSVDHIFMLDPEGRFQFSNNRFKTEDAGPAGTVEGKAVRDLYEPAVTRLMMRHLKAVFKTGRPATFEYAAEPSAGVSRHYLCTLYPIFRAKAVGAVGGICRDTTEKKHLENQLFQAQKMDALGTLVAGMAHEINNPVNLIMLNLPLIQKVWCDLKEVLGPAAEKTPARKYGGLTYGFLAEHLEPMISDMDAAAHRIATIVKQLKSYSKKTEATEKKPISLNDAVANAVKLVHSTARKSNVELKTDLGQAMPLINGNLQNMEQITMNLVINGLNAIGDNVGCVEISTGFSEKKGDVFLRVADDGSGVDPAIAGNIFDPFVTGDRTRGGTGLGLAVTWRLVREHGGEISYRSRKERGTVFTVNFPVRGKVKRKRILVADDQPAIRKLIVRVLSQEPAYTIEEAKNGTETLIKLGTFRPDLLILDIHMPEMDGLEVCRSLVREPELSAMKVVIVTGYPNDKRVGQIQALGFGNVIEKPLNVDGFKGEIRRILRGGTKQTTVGEE